MTFTDLYNNGTFTRKDITTFITSIGTVTFIDLYFNKMTRNGFVDYYCQYEDNKGKVTSTKRYENSLKAELIERPCKIERWINENKEVREQEFMAFITSMGASQVIDNYFNQRQFGEAMGYGKTILDDMYQKAQEIRKQNEVTVPGNVRLHFDGIYSRIERNKKGVNILYVYDPRDKVEDVLEYVEKIGAGAFFKADIEEIVIPFHIKDIAGRAFNSNLKRVKFKGNSCLKIIRNCAFKGCDIEELILPESLEEIGEEAFADCDKLIRISFEGAKSKKRFEMGENAFKGVPFERRVLAMIKRIQTAIQDRINNTTTGSGGVTQ